ncbi:MAG: 50S ribosomal protein P1 [Candidatus Altiarchaeota archaeon]
MEYVYGALLLHSAGQPVNEESLKKVMTAGGVKADEAKIKALVASLEGVNIDEAVKTAAPLMVAPTASKQAGEASAKEEKMEKPKEDKKSEEEAASGLASLFG